jgi:competence protein ComEA
MDSSDRRRTLLPYLAAAVLVVLLAMRVLGGGGGGAEASSVALDGPGGGAGGPARPAGRARSTGHPTRQRVWVHVAGEVRRPGLYRVAAGVRAGAAVDAAGGLLRRADLRGVNLAATVRDGQQIIVPTVGEAPIAGAPAAAGHGGAAPPGTPAAAGAKISLSSATVEQLDGLDGIGPTLAQRIVQWREAHGGFRSVDQLREVEGIGDKRLQALKAAVEP